jgi:hypothetical protein
LLRHTRVGAVSAHRLHDVYYEGCLGQRGGDVGQHRHRPGGADHRGAGQERGDPLDRRRSLITGAARQHRAGPSGHLPDDGGHTRRPPRRGDRVERVTGLGLALPVVVAEPDDDRREDTALRQPQRPAARAQALLVQRGAAQQVFQELALGLELRPDRVVAEESADRQRVRGVFEHEPHGLCGVAADHPPRHEQPAPASRAGAHRCGRPAFRSA